MKKISDKRSLIMIVLVAANCIRPTKGFFGIPDFLELGVCVNVTLVDGFDPVKYQGLWFDIERVPNEYQQAKQCNRQNFTWTGDRMISIAKGVTDNGKKLRKTSELLESDLREPPHPAHMTVVAEDVPEAPYEVISTDYVTYACVHSCLSYFALKAEFFWIYSRRPTLAPEYVTRCYDALTNMGLDPSKMEPIPQGQFCPYNEKLDQMLDANREVMIRLGLPAPAAHFPTLPAVFLGTENEAPKEIQDNMVNVHPVGVVAVKPESEDETFLEQDSAGSSAPLKTSTNVIPLFNLVAILLPVLLR